MNGNKMLNGIKLVHWNKDKTYFHRFTNEIHFILDKYKPDILSLSEANIDLNLDSIDYKIDYYNIETTDQLTNMAMY